MRLLAAVLTATLTIGLLGCGSGDDADPSQAPQTNVEARKSVSSGKIKPVENPKPVPELTLQTMDGEPIALREQSGKVLLINFWATWCPPCREEIPDLIDLQEEFGPQGLRVVGVATDREGASVVRPFVEEQGINYPIVLDSTQSISEQLGPVYGLPTTVVVNAEGKIAKRVVGMFPADEFRPTLKEMLEG
jgi:peroxiredoxin